MNVIRRYALSLKTNQGNLVLVGVSEPVHHQLEKTGLLDELGQDNICLATSILGDSSLEGYQDANTWLKNRKENG